MTHEELLVRLAARKALIVHFSHHAVMREGLSFPADLQQVLTEQAAWPLSCSVLTPGHRMVVVGSVGVVLEPRSAEDILRVHHDDAGAYADRDDSHSLGEPLSDSSFDASLDRVLPGTYNEWRVRGAKPIGLFVVNPANIEVRQRCSFEGPWGPEEAIAPAPMSFASLKAAFPGWPVWTMTANGPLQL